MTARPGAIVVGGGGGGGGGDFFAGLAGFAPFTGFAPFAGFVGLVSRASGSGFSPSGKRRTREGPSATSTT